MIVGANPQRTIPLRPCEAIRQTSWPAAHRRRSARTEMAERADISQPSPTDLLMCAIANTSSTRSREDRSSSTMGQQLDHQEILDPWRLEYAEQITSIPKTLTT